MNGDIKPRHAMRVAGPPRRRFEGTRRTTIDFSVPEAKALTTYVKRKGKQATRQTVLVDGLQLLPGFSVILKQEQELYAKSQNRSTGGKAHDFQIKRIKEEFN